MLHQTEKSRKQFSNTAKPIIKKAVLEPQGSLPRSARLEEYSNRRARSGFTSTEADGTENKDSPPNFSKIAETQASKTCQGSCNKEKRETSTLLNYNKGAKRLRELKLGDAVGMKPDPKVRKKMWKKATCLQEVEPRSYKADIEGTRYRRNRKDLIATQIIDPVQPGKPLSKDTASERPETSHRAPEIPQLTERRSIRGRLIRTPIRLKDYSQSRRTVTLL